MNLSIPDAAVELAVSETRLRRTLLENAVSTLVEFRQTRTGVRKTMVLSRDTIAELRAHFAAPALSASGAVQPVEPPVARAESSIYEFRSCTEESAVSAQTFAEEVPAVRQAPVDPAQSVPVAQFNALLYQHNVLREELTRVAEYLDGCDRLLGEMVRTIATLEERTRELEPVHAISRRDSNPLSGALRTVAAGVQNALFSRTAAKPMLKPAEVYYGNVLAGR